MGEQSTINLLSNINGSLNKIVELMLPQNKDNTKADANKVKNLSQGSFGSGKSVPNGSASIDGLNVSISDIVSSLDGLPQQVLEIAKLADGTVDQFKSVLIGIASTLNSKELSNISEKELESFKNSMLSVVSVFRSDEFLAISDESSNKSSELIIALSKLETLPNAIKSIATIEASDVQSLEVFIKGVVSIFKADIFNEFDSASAEKTGQILNALTNLKTLPAAVKNASKIKKSDVTNLKDVISEIVSVFTEKSFKDIDADSAKSAMEMITALSKLEKLPDIIKGASKVKERDVKNFAKCVVHIMEMISKSLRKTNVSKDDIQLAQNTADAIGKLASSIKMLAKMTLIAPLALIGVLAMIPVWVTFGAVAMLIGKLDRPINRGIATLRHADRFMNGMMKTALLGVAVAGSVILLGMVMQNNMDVMMYGLAGLMVTFVAVGAIAILGGLVGRLVKSTNMFSKQIIFFTLSLIAIAGLVTVLGLLVKSTWKETKTGLAAMTVMLAYTLVIGLAAWVIGRLGLEMAQLKTMAGLMFLTMGLMAMTLLTVELGKYVEKHIQEALIGLAGTLAILTEVSIVAYVAKRVGNSSKSAVKDLLLCEGVILAAQAIVYSTIKLGTILWDYIHEEKDIPEKLGILFLATTAIITGAWGVTKIAKRASTDIKKGAIALLLAEGVILASSVVAMAVIGVTKLLQNAGIETSALLTTLGIMGSIVAGAGAVAFAASKAGNNIKKGVLTIAAIELLILGMVGVVYAIVKVSDAANKLDNKWDDVNSCVKYMAGLMTGITAFAIGIGVLAGNPLVGIAITAGLAILGGISLIITAVTGTTFLIIKLKEKIDNTGYTTETLGKMLHSITHDVFSYENLNPAINKREMLSLVGKYMALTPVLLGISSVIRLISNMARQFGGMVEMTDGNGNGIGKYTIRPFYGMNGNTPIYGEPVNLPIIAKQIVESVTIFGQTLYDGFNGVSLKRLLKIGVTMGYLVEPVSKFATMVSGFTSGDNADELRPVFMTETGDIKYGPPVNIVNVATLISTAISEFAKTLYGDGKELPNWMMFTRYRKGRNRIKNAMSTLASIVEPVDAFAKLLTSYQSAGDGKIRKVEIDSNGNINENAPYVDVVEVATTIAGSIGSFADILFGENATWMKNFKDIDSNGETKGSRAMKSLALVIAPVSSFVDALTALDPDGDKLYAVDVDNNGIIHRRPVDIVNTAAKIAEGISEFVQALFGDATIDAWQNMIHATKGGLIEQATGESSEGAVGVLSTVIDPISNFVTALSTLGGEKAEDGTLAIPIYNKDGKIVDTRKIDMVFTAETIAKAVEKFLKTLFSQSNQKTWYSLIYGYNDKGELGSTASDTLKQSIGIFTAIVDPVVKFMEVITKFRGTPDKFEIFDGKKPRTINLIEVATSIATAVNTFMTHIKTAFDAVNDFDGTKNQDIQDFANSIGSILENFAKIGDVKQEQLDLASKSIDLYFESLKTIKTKLDEGLPVKEDMTALKDVIIEAREIFTLFNDIKFEELNYRQGLKEFKHIAQEAVSVSGILAVIGDTNNLRFDVVDQYLNKVKSIHEFISAITNVGMPGAVNICVELVELMSVSYESLPTFNGTVFKLGDTIEQYISRMLSVHNFIVSVKGDFGNPEVIKTGVELVETMATSYLNLPTFSDINKLAFITDYVNAVSLIRTSLFTNRFNNDAQAMTALVTSITASVKDLTMIREGDIKAVSGAYTKFLERMIVLSSKANRKSLVDTHEALDDLTTSMTRFDKELIRKSDERKKKLDELIEQVEHLNDKLETTGTSMKKLVDYLEDVEESKLDKVINAGQNMNSQRTYMPSGTNSNNASKSDTQDNTQVVPMGLSANDGAIIANAIRDALNGMRLNSGSLTMSQSLVSQSAFNDDRNLAQQMAAVIDSLKNLDFEFTAKGGVFYGSVD